MGTSSADAAWLGAPDRSVEGGLDEADGSTGDADW